MKLISKDLTKKLKEKGFTFELPIRYDGKGTYYHYVDPQISQVLKWLRENKNIHIGIVPYFTMSTKNNIMWQWEILLIGKIIECKNTLYIDKDYNYTKFASADCYSGYDDAYIDTIEFVINNLI